MYLFLVDRHGISEDFGGDKVFEFGFIPKDGAIIIQLWGKAGN